MHMYTTIVSKLLKKNKKIKLGWFLTYWSCLEKKSETVLDKSLK
jgi:activator of HSP90 ATPase